MNKLEAIDIVEGMRSPRGKTDKEKYAHWIECWQFLIDSGTCWKLQGWFGRTAARLIDEGTCHLPSKTMDNTPIPRV